MSEAIRTESLTKRYGDVVAVDRVDLRVAHGEIYAFLGLNGAGKTTTIRALLGMVRPTAGSVTVLGERVGPRGRGPWHRVGHLVEKAAAYPQLTVRENLEVAARLQQIDDAHAVVRAIERFAIGPDADRRAGMLSTGNLQRLALARALLHDPELVILDEPVNGLDPAGVAEVRTLLRELTSRGRTVFLSSHVLAEVSRLAHRIGIIHRGRLVTELGAAELERGRERWLAIDAHDRHAARRALAQAGYELPATADGPLRVYDARAVDAPEQVAGVLVAAGTPPTRLVVEQESLEDQFLRLTGTQAP